MWRTQVALEVLSPILCSAMFLHLQQKTKSEKGKEKEGLSSPGFETLRKIKEAGANHPAARPRKARKKRVCFQGSSLPAWLHQKLHTPLSPPEANFKTKVHVMPPDLSLHHQKNKIIKKNLKKYQPAWEAALGPAQTTLQVTEKSKGQSSFGLWQERRTAYTWAQTVNKREINPMDMVTAAPRQIFTNCLLQVNNIISGFMGFPEMGTGSAVNTAKASIRQKANP